MKTRMLTSFLGAALSLTTISSFAATPASELPQAVYKCGMSPDNMIGLASEYTILTGGTNVKVILATVAVMGYQIEEGRTHQDTPPKITKQGSSYVIEARLYSSENATALYNQVLTLDTQKQTLLVQFGADRAIPLPCKQVFP